MYAIRSYYVDVKKLHTNKNKINNTDLSNIESNHILSLNEGIGSDVEAYSEYIREKISLEILKERNPFDCELLDGIYDLILETVLCDNDTIIVSSNKYPAALVT